MKEYKIVEESNITRLQDKVTQLINNGYDLVAGVSVSITDDDITYVQALIKSE